MALSFKLEGDVLEIHQTILTWNKTHHQFWYYNIRTWMVSSHGRKGDTPDRPMTRLDIDWVKEHYLSKLQGVAHGNV
jgi:hypothetical protein